MTLQNCDAGKESIQGHCPCVCLVVDLKSPLVFSASSWEENLGMRQRRARTDWNPLDTQEPMRTYRNPSLSPSTFNLGHLQKEVACFPHGHAQLPGPGLRWWLVEVGEPAAAALATYTDFSRAETTDSFLPFKSHNFSWGQS